MSNRRGRRAKARARKPEPSSAEGWLDALEEQILQGGCTARGCSGARQRWITVRKTETETVVVYPVCAAHVEAVWLWLGCDVERGCPAEVHRLAEALDPYSVLKGLALELVTNGGRVGVPRAGDFGTLDVLTVVRP